MTTVQETELLHIFREVRQQAQTIFHLLANLAEKHDIQIKDEIDTPTIESAVEQSLALVLRERASQLDRLFRLAVVGDFSRGKSTLINALLQREVLASDSRPNTATQTVLRHGSPDRFVITYFPEIGRVAETRLTHNLLSDLAQFISEAFADGQTSDEGYADLLNGKRQSLATQVASVDVWFDNDFLRQMEIEIVDTPGLGSVFPAHKEVTLKTIRSVDATLFVIQIDPGVGQGEIAFIRFISEYAPQIFFVATKSDYVSVQELPERIEHMRKTIQIKAKVNVEHIFPVSAFQVLLNQHDQSGFDQFVPALETFLIQSSGVPRLAGPLRFARLYARQILDLLEGNLRNVHSSQHQIEVALETLKSEAEKVRTARGELTTLVDNRVDSIRQNALYGLDGLSEIIKGKVERELLGLSLEQLRQADRYIQAAAKEAIVDWLNKRKENFASEIKSMNRTIKSELLKLLEHINFDEEQLSQVGGLQIEFDIPLDTSLYTRDIGDQIVKILLATGISSSIADVVGNVARAASNIWDSIQGGINRLFGTSSAHTNNQTMQVCTRLCEALLAVQPKNNKNAYQMIVYGQGQSQNLSVQQAINDTFTEWGRSLKKGIERLIDNNLNIRLNDLEAQLQQRKKGLHDQQRQKKSLQTDQNTIQQILSDLEALDSRVKSLISS